MKESLYKQSGVDIDAADDLIDRIKPHAKKTVRSGVMGGIGGFGALFDLKQTRFKDPVLVSSTDGVGTKIKIAIETGMHDTIGIDCVAMCVNDVAVQGAEPLFFLDYFATGKLDNDVAERVIAGVAQGCVMAGCALIGGETAEMPGLYAPGDYDLAGFSVGAAERTELITGENVAEGDVILGIASSGLHSNGFSLVRKLVETSQGYSYDRPAPELDPKKTLGEFVLAPTKIYVKPILQALGVKDKNALPAIRAMAHITGGGILENVPRVLPKNLTARIDAQTWALPPVFRLLKSLGRMEDNDLATTLNCGLGLIVVVAADQANDVKRSFEASGETVFTIGSIIPRSSGMAGTVIENTKASWN